jgi:ABC-type transporter Mla MlaB component
MLTQCNAAAADVASPAGFAATDGGDAWRFAGPLTFDNVTAVFTASQALALPSRGTVDLRGITHADSSALAVMLALLRRATREGRTLVFAGMPDALVALARVYGVDELLLAVPQARAGSD